MNVADGLKRLKRTGPELMNGSSGSSPVDRAAQAVPLPGALMAALPLAVLTGAAVVALRWRGDHAGVGDPAEAVRQQAEAARQQANSARQQVQAARSQAQAKGSAVVGQMKEAVQKVRPPRARRKPRNLVRYYGLGALIAMIERDATRKVLVTTLKWMQKRA